jgi:hypothetical protein
MNNFIEIHDNIKDKIEENISYLNNGGCGFFAYFMCKNLVMLGYKPKILVLDYENAEIEKKYYLLQQIKNSKKVSIPRNSLSAPHFMVYCEGYMFDSNNIVFVGDKLRKNINVYQLTYIGDYTIEDMAIALYRDKEGWNNWYERIHNPHLYNIIKKEITKLK